MSQLLTPINRIYPAFTYHKIEQHPDDKEIVSANSFPYRNFPNFLALVIPLCLGYAYLSVMRWLEVHRIVSATFIYPIVLVNYAATKTGQSLFNYKAPQPIKITLMQLSTEILIWSVVVCHDLFIWKP